MLAAILVFAVLAGLDNLQACSALGVLPITRAQRLRFAFAFGACETLAPLAGMLLGHAAIAFGGGVAERLAPAIVLACGIAVVAAALRDNDVAAVVNGRPLLFSLPLSLSFDNVIAGVGLGAMRYPVAESTAIVGLVSAAMSVGGLYFGGAVRRFVPARAELFVGAYLCVLAIRTFFSDQL